MIEVFRSARDSAEPLLLSVVKAISALPVDIIPADLPLTQEAARLKARGRISYADCFAAALAKMRNAELVTGDPEFKQAADIVKILWID